MGPTGRHLAIAASIAAAALATSPSTAGQTASADLVLYATDAPVLYGTWQRVDDASAAGGARVWHPNAGVPKIATPSATPRDYFELAFEAEAGRAYRLWIRGRAENDFYTNDSVYVQFSGSVNASGAAVYRIGTTSATTVVIENCSGCALSGWGWQDNEYGGTTLGPPIYFAQSGPQTLRIQGREDGISIDQVVLSSAAYFNEAPGALRDDATILPDSQGGAPPPPSRLLAFTTSTYHVALVELAAVADLNGDGLADVAGVFDNAPVETRSAINTGSRTWRSAHYEEMWGGPESVRSLELADLTRDGRPDLVYHDRSYNNLVVMPGNGDGTFAGPLPLMTFGERVGDFVVADFNRDAIPDLVTTEPERNAAVTYLGNGDGTFTFLAFVNSGPAPSLIATGDFNGDGLRDIATLNADQQSVYFSVGDGTGRFPRQASVPTGALPSALAVRDVNRDGFDDIVIANQNGTVTVNVATADGSFQPKREFASSRIAGMLVQGNGLAIADMNGDAHPDLIVQHNGGSLQTGWSPSIAILPGAGDGSFGEPEEFGKSSSGPVLPEDLDGDGRQDLLLPVANSGFSVMWNDPVDANRTPVANAGPDVTVRQAEQSGVMLSGQRSTDPDAHAFTYSWTDASGAQVSNGPLLYPFRTTQRAPGTYTFTLTIDDLHGGRSSDAVTVTITADGVTYEEIVITPGSGERVVGTAWTSDGVVVRNPNAGAPKVNAPLPSPSSYVDFTFVADPALEYKLWVRLKAENDYWGNDSLWMQFSGARNATGSPIYSTGTNTGLWINLEECSGCGLSGWGWRDDAWGAAGITSSTLLRFPGGGMQTVRIQTREDGVSVDHIMLSAVKFKTTRPGAVKNDTTRY